MDRLTAPLVLVVLLLGAWAWSAGPRPLAAQAPDPGEVDEIFREWDREGSPGCAVGVYEGGEVLLARGYGEADLDWGIPVTPETVFYSGSVSKQFTAALAALLHLDGTLDLDSDVRRIIPELPPYDPPVTVRQLVHHTSGIRDIYGLIGLSGGRVADAWTDAEYLEILARQRTLNHEPGSDYLYSNGAYFLLTTALERASGESLDDLARERIFAPLGMADTHFHQDPERIVPRRAMSYGGDAEDGFRQTYLGNFDKAGAGGLYTTVRDLAAWNRNFTTGEVGGEDFLELVRSPGVLTTGDTLDYAFGLVHGSFRDRPTLGHSGSFMGFRADYVRFPEDGIAVAALCNLGSIAPSELTREVARVTLDLPDEESRDEEVDEATSEEGEDRPPEPPEGALADYAGTYWSPEVGAERTIVWTGEELQIQGDGGEGAPLEWEDGERFRGPDGTLEFVVEGGKVEAFVLDAGRVRNLRFHRKADQGR